MTKPEAESPEEIRAEMEAIEALFQRLAVTEGESQEAVISALGDRLAGLYLEQTSGWMHASPSPEEWVQTHFPGNSIAAVLLRVLGNLGIQEWAQTAEEERGLREEAEKKLAEERQRNEELRELLKAQSIHPLTVLGDRHVIPQSLVEAMGPNRRGVERRRQQIVNGELFPSDEGILPALQSLEFDISGSQLAHLTTPQIRVLLGHLRAMSSGGDNGEVFRHNGLRIPFSLFCLACEVDARQTKESRALFDALDTLQREEVYLCVEYTEERKRRVMGMRSPILIAFPEWEEDQERARTMWVRRKPNTPWDGPLPSSLVLGLPDLMRPIFRGLYLDGSILKRLEGGGKEARGANQGFRPIDFALYLEITQTLQRAQKSDQGNALSYVDRDAFLQAQFGEEKVRSYKRSGRYKTRIEAQYLRAVEVLIGGKLIFPKWAAKKKVRTGFRDVFELNPEPILNQTPAPKQHQLDALPPEPAGLP